MQHTLEQHKSFTWVAWTTIILFMSFTFYLVSVLNKETSELSQSRSNTVDALDADLRSESFTY